MRSLRPRPAVSQHVQAQVGVGARLPAPWVVSCHSPRRPLRPPPPKASQLPPGAASPAPHSQQRLSPWTRSRGLCNNSRCRRALPRCLVAKSPPSPAVSAHLRLGCAEMRHAARQIPGDLESSEQIVHKMPRAGCAPAPRQRDRTKSRRLRAACQGPRTPLFAHRGGCCHHHPGVPTWNSRWSRHLHPEAAGRSRMRRRLRPARRRLRRGAQQSRS